MNKSTIFEIFCGVMAIVFFGLTMWSFVSGKKVVDTTISESNFEQEAFSVPHAEFEQKSDGVVTMELNASSLSNSWVWLKTVVLDENNDAVLENTFELSYYHGSGWSEGDRETTWTFYLPKGKYKVLVYGEDAQAPDTWTRPGNEMISLSIFGDGILSRYFVLGLVVFGGLGVYSVFRSEDQYV
jgi:hypothetical protein